jgi:hypothetical protein
MRVVPSADRSSASMESVEELAGSSWATGAGGRSLRATWLVLSGAAFAGERR